MSKKGKEEFFDSINKISELSMQAWLDMLNFQQRNKNNNLPAFEKTLEIFTKLSLKAVEDPEKLYKQQLDLYSNYTKIWGNVLGKYFGEDNDPIYAGDERDKRFKDKAWDESAIFNFIKQSYILTSDKLIDFIDQLDEKDTKTKEKFEFFTKQLIDAMSPSNFAFTNPEIIKETIDSKGDNLVRGFKNLHSDIANSKDFIEITTTDKRSFTIGGNIASTKGKIIYKNDLIELIHYTPVKDKYYEIPLLIIPAWINKYYILDLSEENSFVRWLLEKGYNVFMISWVNPNEKLANKKFEDYLLEGPVAAIEQIEKAVGAKQVNAIGYCLGGTLLACLLAYFENKKLEKIKSASLLTTMVDFSYVGDMSFFIDEKQLEDLNLKMEKIGYLDGAEMSSIFSAIRANDLIWSFVVNNYLLGKEPFPFDILYWNADSTRLPAATHSFYLKNMYLENNLAKPNKITLAGEKIDVTKINTDTYILAAKEDHIAPWTTTFKTTNIFKGNTKFILSSSGHVAGVINPPKKKKYSYWENNNIIKNPEKWLKQAENIKGSWWDNWHKWCNKRSGQKIAAKKPKKIGQIFYDAPGKYVIKSY